MKTLGGNFSFLSSTPEEDFMHRIERELDDVGFAVLVFIPDDRQIFAAFSLGLTGYGHPELAVFATCEDSARCFLLHLIEQVLCHAKAFKEGVTSTAFYPSLEVIDLTDPLAGLRVYDELLDAEDVQVFGVRPKKNFAGAPSSCVSAAEQEGKTTCATCATE